MQEALKLAEEWKKYKKGAAYIRTPKKSLKFRLRYRGRHIRAMTHTHTPVSHPNHRN